MKIIFLLCNSWTKEFMTEVCFTLIYQLFLGCSLPLNPTTSWGKHLTDTRFSISRGLCGATRDHPCCIVKAFFFIRPSRSPFWTLIANDNFRLYSIPQTDTGKCSIVYMTYLFYLWRINPEPESCKALEKCFEVTKNVHMSTFEGGLGKF